MRCRDYEYYYCEWRTAALQTMNIKYDSRISVRKNNRAVDKYRKIAMLIGETYPNVIDKFAENMNDENEGIRLRAAVCLIELMPHTKVHLSKAKTIIFEHVAHHLSIPETDIGWNWWLSQPWAEESNCTDY